MKRLVMAQAVVVMALLVSSFAVGGHATSAAGELAASKATETTETTEPLPGTTLEAEQRDDDSSPAAWLIGSGLAAAAAVAIGGTLLKRRSG